MTSKDSSPGNRLSDMEFDKLDKFVDDYLVFLWDIKFEDNRIDYNTMMILLLGLSLALPKGKTEQLNTLYEKVRTARELVRWREQQETAK